MAGVTITDERLERVAKAIWEVEHKECSWEEWSTFAAKLRTFQPSIERVRMLARAALEAALAATQAETTGSEAVRAEIDEAARRRFSAGNFQYGFKEGALWAIARLPEPASQDGEGRS